MDCEMIARRPPKVVRLWTLAGVLLCLVLGTGSAAAHVALDLPNGGEILQVGSVYTIMWHDTVQHGPARYHLWYSTTGPNGPWHGIAFDLTFSSARYSDEWTVPDIPSDQVRIMVEQDNEGTDYDDMSDANLVILQNDAAVTVDDFHQGREIVVQHGDHRLRRDALANGRKSGNVGIKNAGDPALRRQDASIGQNLLGNLLRHITAEGLAQEFPLAQALYHLVEVAGQGAELVIGQDGGSGLEVPGGDAAHRIQQHIDRTGQIPLNEVKGRAGHQHGDDQVE